MRSREWNRDIRRAWFICLLALVPAVAAAAAPVRIEPGAVELAKAVTAKIGGAETVRVLAAHVIRPAPGLGGEVETGKIQISVERPNKFHALEPAGIQTMEIAYDGRTLCVMHPQLKHHGIESLPAASIEEFADAVDRRFGFRPPVAELLAKDVSAQLFANADSARITGRERVGWTLCDRLRIEQGGLTGDLWVGVKDKLPRRMLLTFASRHGHSTWDIRLSRWELNVPLDSSIFSKRPVADSLKVQMIKSR